MARPKFRRGKSRQVPAIPVYKPLRRPAQLQEDRLAPVVADGIHRPLSEAGMGTGGGEWGFHAANGRRPKPIRHLMAYEDQARRELQLIELEGWIRDCLITSVEPGMGRELPHVRIYHQGAVVGRRPRVFPEREVRRAKPEVAKVAPVRRQPRVLRAIARDVTMGGTVYSI